MVETSNPKVMAALESKIAKLEEEKLLLTDKLSQNTKPKSTLSEIIELLRDFLSSPWNIYEKGSLEVRKTILKTALKAPLAYDRQNGYRTPQVSVIFDFIADFTSKCEMVRSRRLELPLRLRNSDLNAARLPIPPRPHCHRLGMGGRIDERVGVVKRQITSFCLALKQNVRQHR